MAADQPRLRHEADNNSTACRPTAPDLDLVLAARLEEFPAFDALLELEVVAEDLEHAQGVRHEVVGEQREPIEVGEATRGPGRPGRRRDPRR